MKFVFIDEEGALSRNWLYCGPPKPELREIIRLRQKDLKKRQVWNQTAADLNGQSATIGTEGEPDEDNCDNLSTKTRKSTDMSGRRDPRCSKYMCDYTSRVESSSPTLLTAVVSHIRMARSQVFPKIVLEQNRLSHGRTGQLLFF